jgi:putative peptidoglycan lipid II flippase
MSLARNFTIVGSATLVSRVTGFVRDMLVAAALGAGAVADAYVAAFLVPNLFRRVVGEGAFNAAFVPIFARRDTGEGRLSALAFSEHVLAAFVAVGLLTVIAGEALMPAIVGAVAGGFGRDSEKFADAVAYGRIMFPFVAVVLVIAVFSGTLNALGRYALVAWAPLTLNILIIVVLSVILLRGGGGQRETGFTLAFTVVAAVVLQFLIVLAGAWRSGVRLVPMPSLADRDLGRLLAIALPGLAIAGAGHLNIVVAAQMASDIPSAVAWLYYAERVFQLPLGFVTAAIGVVLLPAIARHLNAGEERETIATQNRALEFGLLVALPAAVALWLMARPIVAVLFERGAFTAEDTDATAAALKALALGLPGFVLVKVFLPPFLAREAIRLPLVAALAGVAVNLLVTPLLVRHGFSSRAAAIGVSLSAWANALVLFVALLANGRFALEPVAWRRLPAIVAATAIMAGALLLALEPLRPLLRQPTPFPVRALALGLVCLAGVAIHLVAARLLGAFVWDGLRSMLGRGPSPP